MHQRALPDRLLDPALRGSTIGAVTLVSVLAFEAMAVATAMPAVADALDGLALYGLAFGGSLAASVVGMVASGTLADRRGPWLPFVIGASLFVLGLVVTGAAPTMTVLVVGRALKGLGIGMAIVTLYLLVDQYPAALQPRMFAAFSAAWVVPALVGPTIAGLLVEHVHWRAVFLAVLFAAIPAALVVQGRMSRLPRRAGGAEAVPSRWGRHERARLGFAVVAAMAIGTVHLTAQRPEALGRAALVVAVLAVAWSARRLLPTGTLRLRAGLPTVIALRGIAGATFFGAEVLVPLLLVEHRGLSIPLAGMVLTAGALGWATGSWAQGRWTAEAATWARRGLAALVLGIAVVATAVAPGVPIPIAAVGWAVGAIGMGMLYPTLSVQVLQRSDPDDQGENVSSLQVADSIASSAALAATGTLIALAGVRPGMFLAGFALTIGIGLVGLAATPRIP